MLPGNASPRAADRPPPAPVASRAVGITWAWHLPRPDRGSRPETSAAAEPRVSRDLVDRQRGGDPAQGVALPHRREAAGLEQPGRLEVLDHRAGREDGARGGEPLHARGDVHGLAEVVLALVERDREAGPLVDADLEQQVLAVAAPP